jgi:hypothetical protein
MNEFVSGAIVQKDYRNVTHADRDKYFGTVSVRPLTYTQDISWLEKNFQRNTPTCGAHAGSHLKAILDKKDTGINRYSPMFLWRALKLTDNFPPSMGTTLEAIMKALKAYGIADWNVLPTDFSLSETSQAYTTLTEAQKDNAQPRIIDKFAITYIPTQDQVKDIMIKDGVVILLLRFDSTWFSGEVHETNGALTYGHFVVAFGYDENYIYVLDSADAVNPIKKVGKQFMISAVGSAIDLPDEEVKRLVSQRTILQKLVELYRQLKNLIKR